MVGVSSCSTRLGKRIKREQLQLLQPHFVPASISDMITGSTAGKCGSKDGWNHGEECLRLVTGAYLMQTLSFMKLAFVSSV